MNNTAVIEKPKKQDKFFKISPERFFKLDNLPARFKFDEFNPSQQAMYEGLSEKRFWVHISARRTGKSIAATILAFLKLLEPNQQVMVVAPDFNLSTIIWDYMIELIEGTMIETKQRNEKNRVIKLVNGSTFRLLSANNRVSLVGRAANLIIVDEAALIPDDEYFTRDLRPALSTFPDSRILFITTPRGKENYIYDFYLRGQSEEFPQWGSGLFPWHVNPILQKEDIEEAEKSLPKAVFLQEYYCSWTTYENQIYNWDEETQLLDVCSPDASYKISPDDKRFSFFGGLDIGFRDATAFVVIATIDDETFYVVDEYTANEGTTRTHASYIKEMIDKWDVEQIFIDSAAQQTKADLAYDYDIFCVNANKSVLDGISHVQGLVEHRKLICDKYQGQKTFRAMAGYKWNTRSEKAKPVHDEHSHLSDAVRYALYSYSKGASMSIFNLGS